MLAAAPVAAQRRVPRAGELETVTTYLSRALTVLEGEGFRKGFRGEALFYSDGRQAGVGTLALFGVFLDVGVKLGVPVAPLAFALLFATNYFSVLTPQGSSANLLFAGSGYLTQGELYRLGAITTVFSFLVYAVAGTPWVLLVAK
ncbi:MAG: anion permease [Holophagales bacterium]|nr:anion permease [Holophagales bacterium]